MFISHTGFWDTVSVFCVASCSEEAFLPARIQEGFKGEEMLQERESRREKPKKDDQSQHCWSPQALTESSMVQFRVPSVVSPGNHCHINTPLHGVDSGPATALPWKDGANRRTMENIKNERITGMKMITPYFYAVW